MKFPTNSLSKRNTILYLEITYNLLTLKRTKFMYEPLIQFGCFSLLVDSCIINILPMAQFTEDKHFNIVVQ